MCASSLAADVRPFAAARLKIVGAGLRRADTAETAAALALATATGAAAGWIWTRQPGAAGAFGAAALAFAPVILLAGAVIAAAHERVRLDTP